MLQIDQSLFYCLLISITLTLGCTSQLNDKRTPQIAPDLSNVALINEVWYEDNQQYIHPSFTYAGSGFLIDTKQGVLAATAKHVLLIANPNDMKGVSPNTHLERWVMRPKNNASDSVLIGQLLNQDTAEILAFEDAAIQLRDWIVFTTQYHSPNIRTLSPRFTPLQVGEPIYFTGCPYKQDTCIIQSAKVLSVKGNRIVFSQTDQTANIGGASGSPLIDANGQLVGVLSGTSVHPENGESALYGISTNYLEKILNGDKDLNKSVITVNDFLNNSIAEIGVNRTIERYYELKNRPNFYFDFHVSPEGINQVAANLLEAGKKADALNILTLSEMEHGAFSDTYTLKGKIYLAMQQPILAKTALTEALRLWPENEEAQLLMQEINQ
ncbi:MAG: serine protease [Bacteroidota bacterium]